MKKPNLKTPPPPEFAYLDLDTILFRAAQSGQQVVYSAVNERGDIVASFDSAKRYSNWIEEVKFIGCDTTFNYEGDVETLIREKTVKRGDVKNCYKTFDHLIKSWVQMSGCKDWTGYISKASGEKNFRYDIGRLKGYKSSASRSAEKPIYLEEVRQYARRHPNIKTARGSVEVDDVVAALSQRKGWRGCLVTGDKDGLGVENTHVFIPDEMEKPQFSSKRVVGSLSKNPKGKVVGLGTLFWLHQLLYGDSVDSIAGCKGVGEVGSYNLLQPFSGVCNSYLPEAIAVVGEAYQRAYGEEFEHVCALSGETVKRHWKDILIEMSHLVYMKKSQNDECFWIPLIKEL